jgi:hypothetical protein
MVKLHIRWDPRLSLSLRGWGRPAVAVMRWAIPDDVEFPNSHIMWFSHTICDGNLLNDMGIPRRLLSMVGVGVRRKQPTRKSPTEENKALQTWFLEKHHLDIFELGLWICLLSLHHKSPHTIEMHTWFVKLGVLMCCSILSGRVAVVAIDFPMFHTSERRSSKAIKFNSIQYMYWTFNELQDILHLF